MDITVVIGLIGMAGMGSLLSVGLVYANKKLFVADDLLLALVKARLPSTNCGGCGKAGCSQFAEGLINENLSINKCVVLNDEGKIHLASILGREFQSEERILARVLCQGGTNEAKLKGIYTGAKSCTASQFVSGGNKLCEYGCIGFGDCAISCPFDAIYMNENDLPVIIDSKCTGCGICVDACPKNIIELHPKSRGLLMLCKSQDINKDAKKACIKSCTACGLCVMEGKSAIAIDGNLAKIDFNQYDQIVNPPDCPRGCFSPMKMESEEKNIEIKISVNEYALEKGHVTSQN